MDHEMRRVATVGVDMEGGAEVELEVGRWRGVLELDIYALKKDICTRIRGRAFHPPR